MKLNHFGAAGPMMEMIDILCNDREPVFYFFYFGQGKMSSVRPGILQEAVE